MALLAGLVLLAAISLLALVATGNMILQRHMAGNFEDGLQARQAAAEAVSQGRNFLFRIGPDGRRPVCLEDCFPPPLNHSILPASEVPAHPEFKDGSWWRSRGTDASLDPVSGDVRSWIRNFSSEPPRFLIEEIYFEKLSTAIRAADTPPITGIGYYRIVGRGVGQGPAAITVDEAIVARPWLSETSPGFDPVIYPDFCTAFKPLYDCGLMTWRQLR